MQFIGRLAFALASGVDHAGLRPGVLSRALHCGSSVLCSHHEMPDQALVVLLVTACLHVVSVQLVS
jgi:hypothetical protein